MTQDYKEKSNNRGRAMYEMKPKAQNKKLKQALGI